MLPRSERIFLCFVDDKKEQMLMVLDDGNRHGGGLVTPIAC